MRAAFSVPDVFRRFFFQKGGGISIMTALFATVIVGMTGLAVDLSSIVYWQRRLQAATDSAALSATFDLGRIEAIAATALEANAFSGAVLQQTTVGTYTDDPELPEPSRFVPGAPGNAVQIATRYEVPVYLLQLLTGSSNFPVAAEAIAHNLPLAGIVAGTSAAATNIALLNAFFDAMAGSSITLTEQERAALDATRISVFRIFDGIATASGSSSMPIEQIAALNIDLVRLADAMVTAYTAQVPSPSAQDAIALNALARIAQQSSGAPSVPLSDFLNLAAHRKRAPKDLVSAGSDRIAVPALSVLLGYLQVSRQNALVNLDAVVSVPGVATITVDTVLARAVLGNATPAITAVGPEGVTAYSSQGRVRLTVSLLQPIAINLGLIQLSFSLSLPIIADFGYGSATIANISCGSDIASTTDVAVQAQTGTMRLYVGSVSEANLTNLLTPLAPGPVPVVSIPLVQVTAFGQSNVAQSAVQTLHFDWNDILQGTVKSAGGSVTLAQLLAELSNNTSITIGSAPLGAGALISSLVQNQISAVLPALLPALDSILETLGLQVSAMNVRAAAARCGIPALVT